jgi:hypothetical protein
MIWFHFTYECNTRFLNVFRNWTGLLIDTMHSHWDEKWNFEPFMLTPANAREHLKAKGIPKDVDLLSVDIDGDDFHLLRAILMGSEFRPRVLIVEHGHGFWWPRMQLPIEKMWIPRYEGEVVDAEKSEDTAEGNFIDESSAEVEV